ncbi:hypothetical protein KOY48_02645 [Candidatus Minimicrobia naudis]|uniref:Uncharacterized protein n=1 Tax=Candidatus Minimicrobia naudis TaxID=2841263 RepID=A0A8F1SBW6_9BACT|nr:hypothetical protein KOY48_02645 [Candidatus Minimicrobia naudis]
MSDTDDDSAALGDKRTYFSGEYEKYSWHNLMSPTITGHKSRNSLSQCA